MNFKYNPDLYVGKGEKISDRGVSFPSNYQPYCLGDRPEIYRADDGLRGAVNVALALGQPLLVTGKPGTGKTQLAKSVAHELELEHAYFEFNVKSNCSATDFFYRYDALERFQDAHFADANGAGENPGGTADKDITALTAKRKDVSDYIEYQALGMAILMANPKVFDRNGECVTNDFKFPKEIQGKKPTRSVVLLDEIDKAPRDVPNDMLNELYKMEFQVRQTGLTFRADQGFWPVVIVTSNSEKNLPEAFLRRCVFYHISFPDKDRLLEIIRLRFGEEEDFDEEFNEKAVEHFLRLRDQENLKRKPGTAELLAWICMLKALKIDFRSETVDKKALELSYSILGKTKDDLRLLEKLIR